MLLKGVSKLFLIVIAFSLFITSCGGNSDYKLISIDYLAVQIEDGDNWSIMDKDGKIVVKEEYNPKDRISLINPDGVYWVKSGIDDKYRLYSIDSPKKPISSDEYVYVTIFIDGKAFVSDGVNPIKIIDTKGNVKETLSKDIRRITQFETIISNRIAFQDKSGKWGYLDMDGNIVIKAQYKTVYPFSDEVALVEKMDDDTKLYVIGKNGKEKGKIDLNKYKSVIFEPIYTEGKLAVRELGKEDRLIYLDKEGNVTLEPSKKYKDSGRHSLFYNGYAIVDDNEGNCGIIDEKGDVVIRIGKYDRIYNLSNGKFLVGIRGEKNKFGIVNSEDEPIIELNYNDGFRSLLGENYIMVDNATGLLVKPNGEEIKNSEFQMSCTEWYENVMYFDIQQIAKDLVSQIETKGFTPIIGKQKITDIANVLNLKAENQNKYRRYIDIQSFKADTYDVQVTFSFNERTIYEKTHKEVVSDGWFSHEKTVSDGWDWNEEAMLEYVYLKIEDLNKAIDIDNLITQIGNALKEKGFELVSDGPYYEAKNGEKYAGISINSSGRNVEIYFYPYREYSENQF